MFIKKSELFENQHSTHSLYCQSYAFSLDWSQKQEDMNWHFQINQRKMYSFTNHSPLPMQRMLYIDLRPGQTCHSKDGGSAYSIGVGELG